MIELIALIILSFIFVQLIGVFAWIFLFLSFYRRNTDRILIFQVISSVLYCIHYYFLEAYSGLLMCALSAIFDYAYYKTDKDKYLYYSDLKYTVFGVFACKSPPPGWGRAVNYLTIRLTSLFLTTMVLRISPGVFARKAAIFSLASTF